MISKQAREKARELDIEEDKKRKKEDSVQIEGSFARKYKICPICSGDMKRPLINIMLNIIPPIYIDYVTLKCENCGVQYSWEE